MLFISVTSYVSRQNLFIFCSALVHFITKPTIMFAFSIFMSEIIVAISQVSVYPVSGQNCSKTFFLIKPHLIRNNVPAKQSIILLDGFSWSVGRQKMRSLFTVRSTTSEINARGRNKNRLSRCSNTKNGASIPTTTTYKGTQLYAIPTPRYDTNPPTTIIIMQFNQLHNSAFL